MGVLSPADEQGPRRGSLVVPKRFWAMANYSHFLRPGRKLIGIDGAGFANTGFVNPKGNVFVVVALNPSAKPQPTVYVFGQQTIDNVGAFATMAELDPARASPPATYSHRFSATLPPMSVKTFVSRESGAFFVEHRMHPEIFDGDGLKDTPPCPAIVALFAGSDRSVTLAGHRFTIFRGNVVSHYH